MLTTLSRLVPQRRILAVMITRASGIGLGLLLSIIVGRHMGASGAGGFFTYLAMASLMATVTGVGLPMWTLRRVATLCGHNPAIDPTRTVDRAAASGLTVAGLAGLALVLFAESVAGSALRDPGAEPAVRAAGVAQMCLVLLQIITGGLKGRGQATSAILIESSAIPAGLLLTLSLLAATLEGPIPLRIAVWSHAVVAGVAAIVAFAIWHRTRSRSISDIASSGVNARDPQRPWLLWLLVVGNAAVGWSPFLIMPHFADATQIGLFSIPHRILTSCLAVSAALASVHAPRFVASHIRADHQGLLRELASSQRHTLFVFVPAFVVFVTVPGILLQLFGPEFADADQVLRILAVGGLATALTGVVGTMLNMMHLEAVELCSVAIGLVATVALSFRWGPAHGAEGVAAAYAVALTLRAGFSYASALLFLRRLVRPGGPTP
jgi:O-antigen/teichoic acid export membrane protein